MSVGAVILCGGESRRMGQSKAWLPFGPERLLQRVVRLVSGVASPLVVVAAPDQDLPPLPLGIVVARDPVRGKGPLQGLATGLAALPDKVELAYATATDVPFLEPAWVRRIVELIGDDDLAIPHCDGRHHPLAALYRRGPALPAITSLLRADRLRPVYLMENLRTREVSLDQLREVDPTLGTLRNLNTLEDYREAIRDAGYSLEQPSREECAPKPARVRVELSGVPRLRAGRRMLDLEAVNLGEALYKLGCVCPALLSSVITSDGTLMPGYTVNLNGDRFATDPATPLSEGDSLILLPADVGG
jgi:molybdopterin-guanine dinucleotide biosynthesis protein A